MASLAQRSTLRGVQIITKQQFTVGSNTPVTLTLPTAFRPPPNSSSITVQVTKLIIVGAVPPQLRRQYLILEGDWLDNTTVLLANNFARAQLTPMLTAFYTGSELDSEGGELSCSPPSAALIRPAPTLLHRLQLYIKLFDRSVLIEDDSAADARLNLLLHLQIY